MRGPRPAAGTLLAMVNAQDQFSGGGSWPEQLLGTSAGGAIAVGLCVPFYLGIRWLQNPRVRAVCQHRTAQAREHGPR